MTQTVRHLDLSLLLLRLGVGLVMAMWTADKFVDPAHSGAVMENFYGLPALGPEVFVVLGVIQAVIVLLFVAGAFRVLSYGTVMLMHAGSTFSSWRQYLDGFDNLLFFAAWPMLAACVALFLLRAHDRLLSVDAMRQS
jgi:putative oxidoreductase